ncbi:mitochondrial 54S ribosomal protein uL4m [Lodderomyces beijingensis]|uniref:Large ribosomal subunit protein uL4m n=1 Tax=Lodderomyces beijingensis TaxID=1775926 RepID=A0ABP0ZTU7_9ASCO
MRRSRSNDSRQNKKASSCPAMKTMLNSIRRLATQAPTKSQPILNIATPPKYTLAQLRTFPSLAPKSFIPLPQQFFNTEIPTRRDLLWSAVVYEADAARVGSNFVTLKSDKPYSGRKLRPQKGSGRARLGSGNSPHLYNEVKAHAIKGPHDWSTDLPFKVYSKAVQTALTVQYKRGNLVVVENECDFKQRNLEVSQSFVSTHGLTRLNMLFVTDAPREKLSLSMRHFFVNPEKLKSVKRRDRAKVLNKCKGKVVLKEDLQVRDILKANRVFVELPALQWLISMYGSK